MAALLNGSACNPDIYHRCVFKRRVRRNNSGHDNGTAARTFNKRGTVFIYFLLRLRREIPHAPAAAVHAVVKFLKRPENGRSLACARVVSVVFFFKNNNK